MNKLNHELSLSIADPRFWSQDHTLPTKLVLLWKQELGYRSIISSFKITQDYFALQHFIHYMLISNQVWVWMRYRERGVIMFNLTYPTLVAWAQIRVNITHQVFRNPSITIYDLTKLCKFSIDIANFSKEVKRERRVIILHMNVKWLLKRI